MNDVDLTNALERIATLERELSEYQRIETKLRENEEKFRLLVESTSDWIWEVDAHGNYTYVSPQVEILLGYSPAEVVGKSPFNFIPSEEIQHVGSEFKKCIENRLPIIALRNTNICKDGTLKILETNGVPFFDKKGEFAG
ncbi:MAG: PAS domain S-box protein, partial [Sulfuricurvum sp.]